MTKPIVSKHGRKPVCSHKTAGVENVGHENERNTAYEKPFLGILSDSCMWDS